MLANENNPVPVDMGNLKIMVVDDDPVILQLAKKILRESGARNIDTACNGLEAIASLSRSAPQEYDIVLCDLNMPEMNGVELLNEIAKNGYNGGILILSGEDDRLLESAYELARAHNLNIIGAISKDLLISEIVNKIQENYQPYHVDVDSSNDEAITINELESGINSHPNSLLLYYQPKVSIIDQTIKGIEILARWQHPERGTLLPSAFIPLAEECGLIHDLTFAIYKKALKQISQWQKAGIYIDASINISVNSFASPDFSSFLIATAEKFDVDISRIILEVTESEIMQDAIRCMEIMMNLRMKKFGLSIDDFGTGHSSMEKLKIIPFTELKIDRAFVRDADKSSTAKFIVESSIELAKKLNMKIVAEGVETRKNWMMVEQMGCDLAQGFYCGAPMSNPDLIDFIKYWKGPH